MRLERITDTEHAMFQAAMELYRVSFPGHERREAASQAEILSDQEYHFNLIYDADTFVGLLLCWETEEFVYVEHFCILPEMRNRRYGQKVLALLEERGQTVILEIDPPTDAVSSRRKEFYRRSGFVENPYPHIHPPYHRGTAGHALVVMSYPSELSGEECALFQHYLAHRVMDGAFS